MSGKSRAAVYNFLSAVLLREVELEELDLLRRAVESLPEPFRSEARPSLEGDDEDVYLRLRLDFTKTLVMYVHPYESVFRDPSGVLCTDLSVDVKNFYLRHGFEPDLAKARVRCFDHLGLELAFMGILVEKGSLDAQIEFLEKHLARWAPLAGLAISSTASTGFYRAIGRLVSHVVMSDYEALKGGEY